MTGIKNVIGRTATNGQTPALARLPGRICPGSRASAGVWHVCRPGLRWWRPPHH